MASGWGGGGAEFWKLREGGRETIVLVLSMGGVGHDCHRECAKRAVAIQLDYFVIPQSGIPRHDRIPKQPLGEDEEGKRERGTKNENE